MPTERQSESARINGAKSHGPKSAEGKKKSSRNSLKHGCTASHTIILACEDPKDFERMVEKYDTMYKPITLEEQDLVAEMISARWRIRRATGVETNLIDCEMVTEEPKLRLKFAEVDCGMVLASAFRSLADESHSMTLLNRYESRLRRIHKQAHAMLLRLRQERPSEPAPPEPPPAPAPTPDLAPAPAPGPDAPEVCAPPTPAAPPPAVPVQQTPDGVIPLTPKPEARCKVGQADSQADSLPISQEKSWQNEPRGRTDDRLSSSVTPLHRHFRSRRQRKIFNAATQKAARC